MQTADIVIIGGGVMGASIAWNLARRGAGRIILLERASIAVGATGKSSAIIRTHYLHETLARMALHARHIFENFADVVGGDAGFHRTGFIAIVSPRDVETVKQTVEMNRRVGIRAQALTPDELYALEPRLDALPEMTGAAAIRAAGDAVQGVETDAGFIAAPTVILAAGYRTRELAAPLGFDVPLTPVRHTMAVVQRTADFGAAHPTISDRVLGVYLRPDVGGLTLVGTTAPFEGEIDYDVEAERAAADAHVHDQVDRFLRRFPSQQHATLRGGFTGIYDCSPDLQPLLGALPTVQGAWLACGFSGHGFKLSPVIGELLADKILDGRTTLVDIDFFDPARFVRNRPIVMQYAYSVQTL